MNAIVEVAPGLWVGGEWMCRGTLADMRWAGMIHACKFPCHASVVGYTGKERIAPNHPEYLWAERGAHLVLNMIDPPTPLFRTEVFTKALDFIGARMAAGEVAIHCNLGCSRAPSIALLYLAKRGKTLPADSYEAAREAFTKVYRSYDPGPGIVTFLSQWWPQLA